MRVFFYIHGVPYGFRYKGAIDERNAFFSKYYSSSRRINGMRIEAVNTNGSKYFYYTYIIGKNVVDGQPQPRSGAYFGLTIKCDQYYTKARNLYYLLDSFFNSYLLNQIITCTNNSYRFLIRDFENNSTIDDALRVLENLISMMFSPADLRDLSFFRQNSYEKLNLADASEDRVQQALEQCGEVSISDDYPLQAVQQIEQSLRLQNNTLQQQCNDTIADLQQQYRNSENKRNQLSVEIERERGTAERHRNQVQELTNELTRLRENLRNQGRERVQYEDLKKRMEKINKISSVDTAKSPCNKLNKCKSYHNKLKRFRFLLVVVLIVLLMLLFVRMFKSSNEAPILPEVPIAEFVEKKEETGFKSDTTRSILEHINDYCIFQDAKIDVPELLSRTTPLKAGQGYDVKVKKINSDVKGFWRCDNSNGSLIVDKNKTIFTPSQKGQYTIYYEVICKQVISRTFNVTD